MASTQATEFSVSDVELLADDVALADIEMTFPTDSSQPWRDRRVYRHAVEENRWYWSQPPAELWGEERTLETEHLLFKYRERDALMIEQIAPQIEDAYLKLHDTLQVSPEAMRDSQQLLHEQKPTLEVVPEDAIRDRGSGRVYCDPI